MPKLSDEEIVRVRIESAKILPHALRRALATTEAEQEKYRLWHEARTAVEVEPVVEAEAEAEPVVEVEVEQARAKRVKARPVKVEQVRTEAA